MKKNEMDNFDTEYIDLDNLLQFYIDEFRSHKRDVSKKV